MRRRCRRRICSRLNDWYFKPAGVPLRHLEQVALGKDELETIRLRYVKGLDQTEAAKSMGISQSQYQRDITETLEKITKALINGYAIRVVGEPDKIDR